MIMRKPVVRLSERGDCHLGEIECPMVGGTIRVQTLGWDPGAALRRAGSAMLQIATDPAIAPFLPPQVTLVAQTARALSKMTATELKETAKDGAPHERKIARALLVKMRDQRRKELEEEEVSGPLGPLKSLVRRITGGGSRKRTSRPSPRRRAGGAYSTTSNRGRGGGVPAMPGAPGGGYTPENPPPGLVWVEAYGNVPGHWERIRADGSLPPGAVPPEGYYPPQQPMPEGFGGTPLDQYAMQAWGGEAYDRPSELQPDYQADGYFEAYEDVYEDEDEADRVPGYEQDYPVQEGEAIDVDATEQSDEVVEEG